VCCRRGITRGMRSDGARPLETRSRVADGTGDTAGDEAGYITGFRTCTWTSETAPRYARNHPMLLRATYDARRYITGGKIRRQHSCATTRLQHSCASTHAPATMRQHTRARGICRCGMRACPMHVCHIICAFARACRILRSRLCCLVAHFAFVSRAVLVRVPSHSHGTFRGRGT
jgi:hypothetical protein